MFSFSKMLLPVFQSFCRGRGAGSLSLETLVGFVPNKAERGKWKSFCVKIGAVWESFQYFVVTLPTMNYVWEYSAPSEEQGAKASELAKSLGISPVLGRLLLERGITTAEEARAFFRPQLSELLDPFLFKDMDKAVARLNAALGRKERILVYGDYDVDGCTAVALVYRFLQQYYSNIDYYIPDRNEEGYGVSRKGVDYAAETGVGLVIVLDCGIKAVEEIAYARER